MSNKANLTELREQYKALNDGKNPYMGWKEAELKEAIAKLKGETTPGTKSNDNVQGFKKARGFRTKENAQSVEQYYQKKGYKTKISPKQKDGKFYLYVAK